MEKIKKFSIILMICVGSMQLSAQQTTVLSQFMFNDILYNPGVAGVKDYMPTSINIRRQWVGINDAPYKQVLSSHGYLNQSIGLGGYIFNHVSGPTRQTGFSISSAYHMVLEKSRRNRLRRESKVLSFGMSFNMTQFVADKDKLNPRESNDPAIDNAFNYKMIPDFSVGLYYHDGNKFYVGLSAANIVETKTDIYITSSEYDNNMVRNYYISGGGNVDFNERWSIQPNGLFRMIEAGPYQIDVNCLAYFKKMVFTGLGYRHLDATYFLLGYKNDFFRVSYSYDLGMSELQNYSDGSHELNLTLLLMNKENSKPKNRDGSKDKRSRRKDYVPDVIDF